MDDNFVGRAQELALLDRLWGADKAHFLVVYGRRRVGKTRLITHWIRKTGCRALYWMADPDSADAHLRQFSKAVYNFTSPAQPAPEEFTYATWDQAWAQVVELSKSGRIGVFLDEFTYLMEADPGIAGRLQRIWDHELERANVLLCLSGSHLGMMQRGVLAYQAPLYGRASAALHLPPLAFGHTGAYFPRYSASDRVTLYAVFGGIPYYWRLIDQAGSISKNIREILLTPGGLVESEARLLLQDFLSDIHNYVSILRAIAHGRNTPKDIETFTGIANVHVAQYLKILGETGYVARYQPVTSQRQTRLGRYFVTDPFLRFYFRFLASRKSQISMGETEQAWRELKKHMSDFIGQYTWEELCREWTLRAANRNILPLYPDQVESAWTREAQVDVVGINSMEGHLVLGECKWTAGRGKADTLRELVEKKAPKFIPAQQKWQVFYLGFSRSGWNEQAQAYAAQINDQQPAGENWECVGMRLVDLEQVDGDLCAWA